MSALPKLTEGSWYNFSVIKMVTLEQGNEYFVLVDPFGTRYLLEKECYKNYPIIIGRSIDCRIDKINCSGRVFIEPRHPLYLEGEQYPFEVIKISSYKNSIGLAENAILVKDSFQNEWMVPNPDHIRVTGKVMCRLQRIKKGQLFLSLANSKKSYAGFKESDWIQMKIKGLVTLMGNQEYWELIDETGNTFYLKRKTYEGYSLGTGKEIECQVIKIKSDWDCIIEPRHPHYNLGEKYTFLVDRKVKSISDDNEIYSLETTDVFGNRISFSVSNENFNSIQPGSSVGCIVKRNKNSFLSLELD